MDRPNQLLKSKPMVPEASRLTRDHWLDEAFNAVVAGGFENVKVLALAEKLKVTRGSFYWHFADHADLIGSLLMRWKLAQLALDEKLKSHQSENPIQDLEFVVDAAFQPSRLRARKPSVRTSHEGLEPFARRGCANVGGSGCRAHEFI
jgi:AcrR family transcriptional regulator